MAETCNSNMDIFKSIGEILDHGFVDPVEDIQERILRPPGVRDAIDLCWVGECSTGDYEQSQEPPSLFLSSKDYIQDSNQHEVDELLCSRDVKDLGGIQTRANHHTANDEVAPERLRSGLGSRTPTRLRRWESKEHAVSSKHIQAPIKIVKANRPNEEPLPGLPKDDDSDGHANGLVYQNTSSQTSLRNKPSSHNHTRSLESVSPTSLTTGAVQVAHIESPLEREELLTDSHALDESYSGPPNLARVDINQGRDPFIGRTMADPWEPPSHPPSMYLGSPSQGSPTDSGPSLTERIEMTRAQFWAEIESVYFSKMSRETKKRSMPRFKDFMDIVSRDINRESSKGRVSDEAPSNDSPTKNQDARIMVDITVVAAEIRDLIDGVEEEDEHSNLGDHNIKESQGPWWQTRQLANQRDNAEKLPEAPEKYFEQPTVKRKKNNAVHIQQAIVEKVERQLSLFNRWSQRFPSARWSKDRDMEAELRQAEKDEHTAVKAADPPKKNWLCGKHTRQISKQIPRVVTNSSSNLRGLFQAGRKST